MEKNEASEEPRFSAHLFDVHLHMQAEMRAQAQPALPNPEVVGELPDDAIGLLYKIIRYAGEKWQIEAFSSLDRVRFRQYIDLKTRHSPSYFTMYSIAITCFNSLVKLKCDETVALDYLYTPDPPSPPADFASVRVWVIQEFLRLYIAAGAFRGYEWLNYPGFGGGPYDDPTKLTYRPFVP